MRVLNCQLIPNTMIRSQKERQGDGLTHFILSKTPWEDGFTNIVTRQPDWWLSKSHWNHVRLFKGSKLFQESGSHCQCFGLCLRTCDWFVNRQRAGPNHASLQRTEDTLKTSWIEDEWQKTPTRAQIHTESPKHIPACLNYMLDNCPRSLKPDCFEDTDTTQTHTRDLTHMWTHTYRLKTFGLFPLCSLSVRIVHSYQTTQPAAVSIQENKTNWPTWQRHKRRKRQTQTQTFTWQRTWDE